MFLAQHSIGFAEFLQGSYIMLAVVMILGLIICAAIAFTAMFIQNKKMKREPEKESGDVKSK